MPVTLVPEQQFFLPFKKVPPGHHSIVRSIVSLGLIFIDKSKLSSRPNITVGNRILNGSYCNKKAL